MIRITETQLRILEALNTYRFLNVSQMIYLGIATNKYTISRNISEIQAGKKPLVSYADFGTFPTIGRLPRLYFLLKHGAEWLAEAYQVDEKEINYPKGVKIFSRDYFHRVATIDVHISGRKFTESIPDMEFDFFHSYFEHTGANHSKKANQVKRQALTKIPIQNGYFIPDGIFRIIDPEGKFWVFTVEVYRGHTTKRTHEQLVKHLYSLSEGSISRVYQYERAVRILMVCEEENAMKSLMKRIAGDGRFAQVEDFFLFATLETVQEKFDYGWVSFRGKKMNMFGK